MSPVHKLKLSQLNRLDIQQAVNAPKKPVIIILDNVRSALNVGSVFRTADAFGIQAIYLCGITALPPHREILKTALGATETVAWKHVETGIEAIEELRLQGFSIAAVEQTDHSIPLNQFSFQAKQALIFGNEVDGVSETVLQLCDSFIEIPQYGMKHSLNISVCAGIVLWEISRKVN